MIAYGIRMHSILGFCCPFSSSLINVIHDHINIIPNGTSRIFISDSLQLTGMCPIQVYCVYENI